MITQDELKKIAELAESVPEPYRQKCFELLLGHALQSVTRPDPSTTVIAPATVPTQPHLPAHKQFVVPIDVKAFISQYGLDEPVLWKLFLVEGNEIRHLYQLRVTKKATAQIQHALMMALETALSTGQFQTDIEALRKRCQDEKCYDASNFAKNFTKNASMFKSVVDDAPLVLSPDGKSELADLIEQLISQNG